MYREQGQLVASATDLVNHLACRHLTALDLRQLEDPVPLPAEDPQLALLQRKGEAWEAAYLQRLQRAHGGVVEVSRTMPREAQIEATLEAMRAGGAVIYQAALGAPGWFGRADFLRRVEQPSRLGPWSYEVVDTKLSGHAKTAHVLQLCFYSWLLAEVQGMAPAQMHVVLGDGSEKTFRCADHAGYFGRLRERMERFVATEPRDTYPEPCEKCSQCRWSERCDAQRLADDHLWEVAGISRQQIRRLMADGIDTLTSLANTAEARIVPRVPVDTFVKLRRQAAVQLRGRRTGKPCFELREPQAGRGLQRLPPPSEGDLYFDMEGDPLHEGGGLEYLFGVSYREGGALRFRPFWGHTREDEKIAFEQFMDFVTERLARYPDLHIYHYAAYENSALKRLMSLHGTREKQVDDLLRGQRLEDLYRVTLESIVASTPSYSIKEIEAFYRPAREGEVKNAGASVVAYEEWRETRDPSLLQSIERYNQDDCESTAQLHEWLLGLRTAGMPWRGEAAAMALAEEAPAAARPNPEREALEARKAELHDRLRQGLPPRGSPRSAEESLREMAADLLDFHRRCDKPTWWKIFSCQDMTEQELIDDLECIGGMSLVAVEAPTGKARSFRWRYRYPEQDFKTREGKTCRRVDTLGKLAIEAIHEAQREIVFRVPKGAGEPPQTLSLTPPAPIGADVLEGAVMRFAEAVAVSEDSYLALRALLRKELPRLEGRAPGQPLVPRLPAELADIIDAASALQESYLFIQGPPGAGKTFTGSHVIVELLRRGKRVGISSNSHKAIHNLLDGVAKVARESGFELFGEKKATANNPETFYEGSEFIVNRTQNAEIGAAPLVAGTAWLCADSGFDQSFDYLFVDEAGQVSLGHLVAMGLAARNIVLLGDQMQLAQPIQGAHPGRSGESTLDYLLDGAATIAPERGIFLASTWRMHPDICRFISDAVYDGRLHSASPCGRQALLLQPDAHAALRPTGICFWPVEHDERSQRCPEEAAVVSELYASLLSQRWANAKGVEAPIGPDDILIVAPYNLQVRELGPTLPPGARVGTVDKFQGQEAAVVIVSLATSSGEYLPRDIEFLYSLNRLNVALSRARCLAVVVASPRLLDVDCRTPEQIRLVNTLCWVSEYSRGNVAAPRQAEP